MRGIPYKKFLRILATVSRIASRLNPIVDLIRKIREALE
jgi:hypothetical protein